MSVGMSSYTVIGDYEFDSIHAVNVKRSRKKLIQTASIMIPNLGRQLDKALKVGDKVQIMLGFNSDLHTEFVGYVTQILPKVPFEIQCEDEMWQLKQKKVNKSYASVKLKDLINDMVPGVKTQVQDLTLSNIRFANISVAKALELIKDKYFIDIYFRTVEDASGNLDTYLFAGVAYTEKNLGSVYYHFQKNVPANQDKLVFKRKEDQRVSVKCISERKNGTTLKVVVPPSVLGKDEEKTDQEVYRIPNVNSIEELTQLANQRLKLLQYDGYKGQMQTFGLPYIDHGMVAELQNDKYPAKDGNFFVDEVECDYGPDGYFRTLELGRSAGV